MIRMISLGLNVLAMQSCCSRPGARGASTEASPSAHRGVRAAAESCHLHRHQSIGLIANGTERIEPRSYEELPTLDTNSLSTASRSSRSRIFFPICSRKRTSSQVSATFFARICWSSIFPR